MKNIISSIDKNNLYNHPEMEVLYNKYSIFIDDINSHISFISSCEKRYFIRHLFPDLKVENIYIFRSSCLIMLYGLAETTINRLILIIQDVIKDKNSNFKYNDLNEKIKKIIKKTMDPINNSKKKNIYLSIIGYAWDNGYKEFFSITKKNNWSERDVLESIIKKIGIDNFSHNEFNNLNNIKNNRNLLAHGNKTFSETGQDITADDLTYYSTKLVEYLDSLIETISNYLKNKEFLLEHKRNIE